MKASRSSERTIEELLPSGMASFLKRDAGSDNAGAFWYRSSPMLKSAFVFGILFICVLASMATYAAPAKPTGPAYFFCRAGLNNHEHNLIAEVMSESPVKLMQFGYGITSRLTLTKSENLTIEVLHGVKVVSTMAVKKGTTQFAMTAGGIEMSCFPNFNRDGL